ncbi:hypothetical protein ACWDZ6_21970 [Streptomyces sp. NPDC002926]
MKARIAAVAVLILILAGCGTTGGSQQGQGDEERTQKMNMQEAAERADAILDGTFAVIKPPVEWTHRDSMPGDCTTDRKRSVMTIVSAERRGGFLGLVERYWKSEGFKFRATSQDKQAAYYMTPDGFQVSVKFGWKGQAHFEVTTPCVEKSEVSDPTSKSNGPDYSGRELPAPNVHSDFWSANTPVSGASPSA